MIPDYIQQNSLETGPLLQEIHSEVCDRLVSTPTSQSEGPSSSKFSKVTDYPDWG